MSRIVRDKLLGCRSWLSLAAGKDQTRIPYRHQRTSEYFAPSVLCSSYAIVRSQLAYCTDTSAKLGPLISDPLKVDHSPSREASYTNANAQHVPRSWTFGSYTLPPHSGCGVPSCCVLFVVEEYLDLESATFEVRRCPRHARARAYRPARLFLPNVRHPCVGRG